MADKDEHAAPREGDRFPWKVHTTNLLTETLGNPNLWALKMPFMILRHVLREVAQRASQIGDIPMDDLMIRLALYEQGEPESGVYDPDAARPINESAMRALHAGSSASIDQAIERAHRDGHDFTNVHLKKRVQDWRTHVGDAVARAWPNMTFSARVAVAIDAEEKAMAEEWE